MAAPRLVPGWLGVLIASMLMAQTSAPAWAQDEDDDEELTFEPQPAEDDEQEMDTDPVGEAPFGSGDIPEGAMENPDAPPEFGESRGRAPRPTELITGYPQLVVLRPLTLISGMSEISAETSMFPAPFRLTSLLEGRYGVDSQLELGLGYGPAGATSEGGVAGKAVSLEIRYLLFDWLSVQAALPVLLDPFAMGLTLGVPLKLRFGSKLALTFGEDLMSFRIWKFVPLVGDPAFTQEELAEPSRINQILPVGELRLVGSIILQRSQEMAWTFETGLVAPDFSQTKSGMPLIGGFVYTPGKHIDLTVRFGFNNLERALENLFLGARLSVRL